MKLVFLDEASIWLTQPNMQTWREKGKPLKVVQGAKRGQRARVNLLGFVEYASGAVGYREVPGYTTKEDVVALLDELAEVSDPACQTVVVLDNASVHRNALVASRLPTWKARGLLLGFLPTSCPHLNDMEREWKRLKYTLLPRRHYQDQNQLRQDVIRCWGEAV